MDDITYTIAVLAASFITGLSIGLIVYLIQRVKIQREVTNLRIELARSHQATEADAEKLTWISQAELKMREAFEALAGKALRENASELSKQTKGEIGQIVDPLTKNLKDLEEHVRILESKREGAYSRLGEQLRNLNEMHTRLQHTTTTLAQALKSTSARGRWGEMQLRRIVEMAGMSDHVDFDEQISGESGRPDMIVHLPNEGILPIDSKVPLDAYLEAMELQDPAHRIPKLQAHARAMKERIKSLALKSYWSQFSKSPDFVVMFVPNEACLGAAFEHDSDLLEFAMKSRVLISSPVNLLALLRTVAYGWQQYHVTENAERIAHEGHELHNRLVVFFNHLSKMGANLGKVIDDYNRTIRSFESRILPSARRFENYCATSQSIEELEQIQSTPIASGEAPSKNNDETSSDPQGSFL